MRRRTSSFPTRFTGCVPRHSVKRDRDYVVRDGEVIIVDEFTGRLMVGRRYSDGLHQAIEAKEGVKIQRESQTLATITFRELFRMYKKLAGMTGTAKTEEDEFLEDLHKLPVIVVPTNKPILRIDYPDVIYKTKRAKYKAVGKAVGGNSSEGAANPHWYDINHAVGGTQCHFEEAWHRA